MKNILTAKFDSDEEDEEYKPNKAESKIIEQKSSVNPIEKLKKENKVNDFLKHLQEKAKENLKKTEASLFQQAPENEIALKSDNADLLKESHRDSQCKIATEHKENIDSHIDNEIMNTIKRLKEKKAELVTHKAKYAGEEFFYEKELDDKERKRLSQVEKNRTHKALDTLVDCITKKKDVNVFDKSKIDWKNYVKKHELERELDFNRKDGYLNKKRFIEETNLKIQDIRKAHEKKSRYSTKNKYHI